MLNANTGTMTVEGDWNNSVGTAGFTEGTSTVTFDGALAASIVSGETFYNLNLNKTYVYYDALSLQNTVSCSNDLHILDGSMEMNTPSNLYVTGNVTLDAGGGLNANDNYNMQITVGKNWTDANTGYDITYGFDPGNYSTVIFNGSSDQYLSFSGTETYFWNLYIDKPSGKFRPNVHLHALGDCILNAGGWEDNVVGLTHTMWRHFIVNSYGTLYNATPQNTIEFKGTDNAWLDYLSASGYFHNIVINKSAGVSVTQTGNTSCQFGGNLTVQQGIFSLGGYFLSVFGNTTVNNLGIFRLPEYSTFVMSTGGTLNVNSGGQLQITGTAANPVTMRANIGTARYGFNVLSGGMIAADYCQFMNNTAPGVNVQSGAIVDLAHAFKGCTFQDGTAGGTLLTLNTNQVMTIRNATFPTNTWSGSSNVTKSVNYGKVYFVDYTGGFSGEAYDNDSYNLVDWMATLVATASASPAAICPGGSAALSALPGGGLAPYSYLWTPSTGLSGTTVSNPVATPAATTTYQVTVTDALGSTVVKSVTVTVNTSLPASVSIVASSNPVPPGTYVTFTATPVNGGGSPSYQWKVNGANVGSGLSTYSYVPAYNDQVSCVMTSNYVCPTGNPATSNVISMIVVNTNTTVTGTVPSPLHLCFDATNTISVGGGGNTFILQSGASAVMIAGMKISYLTGTTIHSGAYMHGYITATNAYCGSTAPPMTAAVATGTGEGAIPTGSGYFAVYPNPTTGKFTLMQRADNENDVVKVMIYGMRGEMYRSESYLNDLNHEMSIADLSVGMYFVKVVKGSHVETFKLILSH